MDWWAMNLLQASANVTRVSSQLMTHSRTLGQKHLDNKIQSKSNCIHPPQVLLEAIDFLHTHEFIISIFAASGKKEEGEHARLYQPPLTCRFTHMHTCTRKHTSQQGTNYKLYLPTAASKCLGWQLPIDTQIADWNRANWFPHVLFYEEDMTVCWWY